MKLTKKQKQIKKALGAPRVVKWLWPCFGPYWEHPIKRKRQKS